VLGKGHFDETNLEEKGPEQEEGLDQRGEKRKKDSRLIQ